MARALRILMPEVGLVDTMEKYLAVAVTVLFVAGICLLVATVRQQIKAHKEWGGRG